MRHFGGTGASLGRGAEMNYQSSGWMVRLHLGRVGDRVNRFAMGRNWAFVKVTPRSYVLVTRRTIG